MADTNGYMTLIPWPQPPASAVPVTVGWSGPVGPGAGGIRTHDDDDMRASRTYFQNAGLASNQRARLQTQKVIRADIFIDPNRYSYRSKHISKHINTYLKQISKHINTYQLGYPYRDILQGYPARISLYIHTYSFLVVDIQTTYPRVGGIIGYHRISRIS